ncbi:hypothetical protein pb186bvf_006693 [Paramecium bursaria]
MFNPTQHVYHTLYQQYAYQQQMYQYFMNLQLCSTMPQYVPVIEQTQKSDQEANIRCQIKQETQIQDNDLVQTEHDQLTQKSLEEDEHRVNGHWTRHEHQLYLKFVQDYEEILRSKYDKKSKKIFKLMSQHIPNRTATQCRSHHQKFNPLGKGKKKSKSIRLTKAHI